MDINPVVPADRQRIEGYGPGNFRISGARHRGSVLVFPNRTLAWHVEAVAELTLESLAAVLDAEPRVELLLIGCGARHVLLSADLRAGLRAAGIALEAMDTGAACRTYNVLMAEDRRVAAALIALR